MAADKEQRQINLNKAYGSASQRLRDGHRDEFNQMYTEEAAKLGETWHPRLTAEQRAAEEFDRLVTEFPFLRDRLPTGDVVGAPDPTGAAEAG